MTPAGEHANSIDAYSPPQMARLVSSVGVRKAKLPALQLWMLGILAGAFIAFGGMFFTLVMTGNELGFGLSRWMGGIAFSLGLILVIIGGAELFTGNNLIVMAWAEANITTGQLARNWVLVYAANLAGALGSVALVWFSGILGLDGGSVARTAVGIAAAKLELGFVEAFVRGVLCNVLVCLAVWLCFAPSECSRREVPSTSSASLATLSR
jgi:formate/nitrite transporter